MYERMGYFNHFSFSINYSLFAYSLLDRGCFSFELRLLKLKEEVLADASKNTAYAKKYWKYSQERRSKKRIVSILFIDLSTLPFFPSIYSFHWSNSLHNRIVSIYLLIFLRYMYFNICGLLFNWQEQERYTIWKRETDTIKNSCPNKISNHGSN